MNKMMKIIVLAFSLTTGVNAYACSTEPISNWFEKYYDPFPFEIANGKKPCRYFDMGNYRKKGVTNEPYYGTNSKSNFMEVDINGVLNAKVADVVENDTSDIHKND